MTCDQTGRAPPFTIQRRSAVLLGCCDRGEIAQQTGPDGAFLVVFDGRIDNRDALLRSLDEDAADTVSNAQLFLLAYRRWGSTILDRLLGDFACGIWDEGRRLLTLARDPSGARPLFFCRAGDSLHFASAPRGLFAQHDIPKAVDDRWLARMLANLPHHDASCVYQNISRVMPGHVLSASRYDVGQRRYWCPENLPKIELSSDAEYEEGLRAVLDEAVRNRIAGSRAVGSHLSSGLDSSSVTALAARRLAATGERLTGFTAVPGGPISPLRVGTRYGDEAPLASLMPQAFQNINHVLISNLSGSLFDAIDKSSAAVDLPIFTPVNHIWLNAIGAAAQDRGIDTLLTGTMGNVTISYNGAGWLAQASKPKNWASSLRELKALNRGGISWRAIVNHRLLVRLPPSPRRWLRAAVGRAELSFGEFSLVRPQFLARHGLLEEAYRGDLNAQNGDLNGMDARQVLFLSADMGMYNWAAKRLFGFDMVDPTADRQVAEYCLRLPLHQFQRPGETRSLIRRAMRGIVPAPILSERRRGLQAADWPTVMTAARDDISAELLRLERNPHAREMLDLPRLRRMLEHWPAGDWNSRKIYYPYLLALSTGLSAGRFVRRVEDGGD